MKSNELSRLVVVAFSGSTTAWRCVPLGVLAK